jgi:DNA-binding transcriptional MerR regulator
MSNQFDELISKTNAARRLGVHHRTLPRWEARPNLKFPWPCIINGRRYYSITEIEVWQASRKLGVEPTSLAAALPGTVPPIKMRSKRQAEFAAIREQAEASDSP